MQALDINEYKTPVTFHSAAVRVIIANPTERKKKETHLRVTLYCLHL
jgi:hypothetical protein